jgi:3-polyprenyl-4-hydroxybenzoate decarboxylase
MYKDLRDFVESVEQLGALRRIDRADPQFETGAITEVAAGRPGGPLCCTTSWVSRAGLASSPTP